MNEDKLLLMQDIQEIIKKPLSNTEGEEIIEAIDQYVLDLVGFDKSEMTVGDLEEIGRRKGYNERGKEIIERIEGV